MSENKTKKINIKSKFEKFNDLWSPKTIAEMNDYQFKIAKIEGDFIWHDHKDTDETFIVIEGEMNMHFREKNIKVSRGEMIVVPRGLEHKPCAKKECKILVIEPRGVVNTGDKKNKLTINKEIWI